MPHRWPQWLVDSLLVAALLLAGLGVMWLVTP